MHHFKRPRQTIGTRSRYRCTMLGQVQNFEGAGELRPSRNDWGVRARLVLARATWNICHRCTLFNVHSLLSSPSGTRFSIHIYIYRLQRSNPQIRIPPPQGSSFLGDPQTHDNLWSSGSFRGTPWWPGC